MQIVSTNDKCIGCNRCIGVCSCIGANVSELNGDLNIIHVDPDRCIACGACIKACEHGAREYVDDTERFFEDLAKGEKISVLIAPAFLANYENEYQKAVAQAQLEREKKTETIKFAYKVIKELPV